MHMVHFLKKKKKKKRNSVHVILMMDGNQRITRKLTMNIFVLSVSPSKEMGQHHTRQRKNSLTLEGIKPTTSGFDQLLLYQLHYKGRWEQVCV